MNKKKHGGIFTSILQLGKIKISIPVALTGFLGYYRASGAFNETLFFTIFGILFLSMAASSFNQIQERKIDLQMKRTQNRPLPSGRISLNGAILAASLLTIMGFSLLVLSGSMLAAYIGAFTMFWYNFVYTPLKRITPFAVLPGAVIGALPPMIGWAAAGGVLLDKEIILISFFLFIGQMPHYWLLLMKIGDEFRDAGLPVITELFNLEQLRNISFIWIFSAGVFVISFPATGIIYNRWLAFVMIGVIILFLLRMFFLSFKGEIMQNWKKAFITVNLFYLFIILILIADKFSVQYLY
ncbi:protoheme IX farnesyltransferase [Bacteroidota bacterium]